MRDRPLRDSELARELLRRPGALAEEADDPPAKLSAQRTELLGILDDEDVLRGVVDEG